MEIIKNVLDNDWTKIKENTEKLVADKIWQRVQDKKVDVLAKLNNMTREKQLEMINVVK